MPSDRSYLGPPQGVTTGATQSLTWTGNLTEALQPDALANVPHLLTEAAARITEVAGSSGREWDVLLIQAGRSKNGRTYPARLLQERASLFEGVPSYARHRAKGETERHPNDKIGKFSRPEFGRFEVDDGQMVEGIQARFKVIAPWARELLKEAYESGEQDFVGFSIYGDGDVNPRTGVVETIKEIFSVDLVAEPAAGGRLQRLVASAEHVPAEEQNMTPEEISALVDRQVGGKLTAIEEAIAKLVPAHAPEQVAPPAPPIVDPPARLTEAEARALLKGRIAEAFEGVTLSDAGRKFVTDSLMFSGKKGDVSDEEITEAVRRQQDYEAALAPAKVESLTENIARAGQSDKDKIRLSLMGWFDGKEHEGIPPLRSLREGYCTWHGISAWDLDTEEFAESFNVKYKGRRTHNQLKESLTSASWGQVFADVLYLRLISEFGRIQEIDDWRMLVSDIVSVGDFRTYHYARVGGYADFTSVSEGAPYPTLTSPGDEEQTFALAKYGGIDDWTMEAALNDVTNKVRQLPTKMAEAASRTLYKWVMNLFTTTNPTMGYDSVAFYDSAHNNTGTAALTITAMDAVNVAMRDQAPFGVPNEVMGGRNRPRFVIGPNELESLAERIFTPSEAYLAAIASSIGTSAELDPQRWRGKGVTYITYDYLTDANDWFVVADPSRVPTAVIGFLNGNQTPELFLQDDPTQGSAFSADKTAAKCRLIWGGALLDHRVAYRQVVT